MKKLTMGLILLLTTCTISFAQTPATSTDSKSIKVEKNMVMKIPTNGDMLYVYKENDKLYLVLDRDYIEKNKWTAAEINDHLAKHAQKWKDNYDTYNPPMDEK